MVAWPVAASALAAGELPPSFAGVAAAVPPASAATVLPARPLPAA